MSTPDPTAEFITSGTEFFKQMRLENQAHMTHKLTLTLNAVEKQFIMLNAGLAANAASSDKLTKALNSLTAMGVLATLLASGVALFVHFFPKG